MTAALEGVKPGDKIVCRVRHHDRYTTHVVERLTPTLAVCDDGSKFNLISGKQQGSHRWARIPQRSELARIEAVNAIARAKIRPPMPRDAATNPKEDA